MRQSLTYNGIELRLWLVVRVWSRSAYFVTVAYGSHCSPVLKAAGPHTLRESG